MLLSGMKLVFSILGDTLEIYGYNIGVCSLPTETLLKRPLFHQGCGERKFQQMLFPALVQNLTGTSACFPASLLSCFPASLLPRLTPTDSRNSMSRSFGESWSWGVAVRATPNG